MKPVKMIISNAESGLVMVFVQSPGLYYKPWKSSVVPVI